MVVLIITAFLYFLFLSSNMETRISYFVFIFNNNVTGVTASRRKQINI